MVKMAKTFLNLDIFPQSVQCQLHIFFTYLFDGSHKLGLQAYAIFGIVWLRKNLMIAHILLHSKKTLIGNRSLHN